MEPRLHQLSQSKPFLSMFLKAGCPSFRPTNNIKALKNNTYSDVIVCM